MHLIFLSPWLILDGRVGVREANRREGVRCLLLTDHELESAKVDLGGQLDIVDTMVDSLLDKVASTKKLDMAWTNKTQENSGDKIIQHCGHWDKKGAGKGNV